MKRKDLKSIPTQKFMKDIAADNFKKYIDKISFKNSTESLKISIKNNISRMPRIAQINMEIFAHAVAFCYDNDVDQGIDTIIENLNMEGLSKHVEVLFATSKYNSENNDELKLITKYRFASTMFRYIIYYLNNIGLLGEEE